MPSQGTVDRSGDGDEHHDALGEDRAMPDMIPWHLQALEIVTCNCAWGCPCQFNALPTQGHCRAGIGYRIERGRFGDTDLAGVHFAGLFAWPGAIHQGSGEALLVVDEKASEPQREAVQAIFRGEHTEPGRTIFNVFSNVIDTYHPTQFRPVHVEADMEARRGTFSVGGLADGTLEPIRNPVTGEPHRARLTLPKGFEYHEAEFASGGCTTQGGPIELDYRSRHGHIARLDWSNAGVAHPT
jgi:hypothetical protein